MKKFNSLFWSGFTVIFFVVLIGLGIGYAVFKKADPLGRKHERVGGLVYDTVHIKVYDTIPVYDTIKVPRYYTPKKDTIK